MVAGGKADGAKMSRRRARIIPNRCHANNRGNARLILIKIKFGDPVSSDILVKDGVAFGARDKYEAVSSGIRKHLIKLRY